MVRSHGGKKKACNKTKKYPVDLGREVVFFFFFKINFDSRGVSEVRLLYVRK